MSEVTGFDLVNEITELTQNLTKSLKQLRISGTELADAEKNYRILLRQEVLKMRDEGQAIGIISLVCHGIPEVAEARRERDVAEAVYTANKEAINVLKLQIRVIENQISREWTSD